MFDEAQLEEMLCKTLSKNGWKYIEAESLPRVYNDVIVDQMVKDALIRLNPVIAEEPSRADDVIMKLRALIMSTRSSNLITQNEAFKELVFDKNTFPFGKGGKNVTIKYFGYGDDADKNEYVVTHQWVYPKKDGGGKRLDIVLLINGFPMVIGELKTPTRDSISWIDGANDIHDYEHSIPQMFTTNVLCFATEGKMFRYGSVGAPITAWGPWHTDSCKDEGTLADVNASVADMLKPEIILDIFRYFTLYATDKNHRKYKVVCRYQQYEGANQIVKRCVDGRIKKGLIWHFQGSGKTLLMVFAAQKLRMQPELKSPTVIIVDDRVDLDTQMSSVFNSADIPNLQKAASREDLSQFLLKKQKKILITTIHKFAGITEALNDDENIILMVDEAHRTQEGNLGECMRTALPNAFFFGLTGTPINKVDKNTFRTFGADEDRSGYMSRYSFSESIRDGATLPLHFESVPMELHIDQAAIDEAFEQIAKEAGMTEEDKLQVTNRIRMEAIVKAPERIKKVCAHIAEHFLTKVDPNGLKGQVVCYDRESCLLYKQELDKLLGESMSTIVIDTNNDKEDKYIKWRRTKDEEAKVLDQFRDPHNPIKLVIVTSKLLTGFDAPINSVMYLDKPMKDHTLLQAICRVNRVYNEEKSYGLIVDYVGIFDGVAKALAFDEEEVHTVISNIEKVKEQFAKLMTKCLSYFDGCDRTKTDWEGLLEAQECLPDNNTKDAFGADYRVVNKGWNALSPDSFLQPYRNDYIWLSKVYESIKPVDTRGALIWAAVGSKTLDLIARNIDVDDIEQVSDRDIIELDEELIEGFVSGEKGAKKKVRKVEIDLIAKIKKHGADPRFIELGRKLEDLRERYDAGLVNSIDFLKTLLDLAKEASEAEKEVVPEEEIDKGIAALTELFNGIKTDKTPIIVERIVTDIDDIVKTVRFDGWQISAEGRRLVKKSLKEIVAIKYKIKDKDLIDRAYNYIETYY